MSPCKIFPEKIVKNIKSPLDKREDLLYDKRTCKKVAFATFAGSAMNREIACPRPERGGAGELPGSMSVNRAAEKGPYAA